MKKFLKDLFTFSRKEQLGLIALIALLLMVTAARILLPVLRGPTVDPGFAGQVDSFEQKVKALQDGFPETTEQGGSTAGEGSLTMKNGSSMAGTGTGGSGVVPAEGRGTDRPAGGAIQPVLIDINRADSTELRRIRGIGPVLSVRIVKYRYLLGGFVRKEQLGEVYGIDAERYALIEGQYYVDTAAVRRIDLNRAGIRQLAHHPYLSGDQAEAIVAYRTRTGSIADRKELLDEGILPEGAYLKVRDYLVTEDEPQKQTGS